MPLTDVQLRKLARTATAQRLSDGEGLALVVPPLGASGSAWWRFDYRFHRKQRTISFGVYPRISLAKARERRTIARRQLDAGQDPSLQRRLERRRAQVQHEATFRTVAVELIAKQTRTRAASTLSRNGMVLRVYVYPAIGTWPIALIEPPDVLAMLRAIEARGFHETAHRAKDICRAVFRYAIATGRATRDPTADLRGALTPVPTKHYASIVQPDQIGALLRAIDGFTGSAIIAAALQLAPLLFVRPGELRRAEWTEIDLEAAVWRIPAEKIKTREAHLVPLAPQASAILRALRPLTDGSRYVFPCARTNARPMSDMALNAALRRIGYGPDEMTPHGFRAMARTVLDEQLHVRPELIELQLAHTVPGALGATYNRASYWTDRVTMMLRWADYLDELRARRPVSAREGASY